MCRLNRSQQRRQQKLGAKSLRGSAVSLEGASQLAPGELSQFAHVVNLAEPDGPGRIASEGEGPAKHLQCIFIYA